MLLPTLLALLLSIQAPHTPASKTIGLEITREFPEGVEVVLPRSEMRELPFDCRECGDALVLSKLHYTMKVIPGEETIYVHVCLLADLEKRSAGNLSLPRLIVHQRVEGKEQSHEFPFERAFASGSWETSTTFSECLDMDKSTDPSHWTRIELVCSPESPFTSTVIPETIVYKKSDEASRAAAVAALQQWTSSRFADSKQLYADTAILGPVLWKQLGSDPALAAIEGPSVVFIDPDTNATRRGRRILGEAQQKALNDALRAFLTGDTIRVRAAISRELSIYWSVIPFDIEEPVLVLDDGTHSLLFDFQDGHVFFIEDVTEHK